MKGDCREIRGYSQAIINRASIFIVEKYSKIMDNTYQKLGQRIKPVGYPLRKQDALIVNENTHLHKIPDSL